MSEYNNVTSFHDLQIDRGLVSVLDKGNLKIPTPIQARTIPIALQKQDVIGIAQTGTGKTLAFALPIVQRLMKEPGTALVLVPTRELAQQVDETVQKICRPFNMRSAVLIGGASMYNQIQQLKRQPRVIIATPGRMNDHIERRTALLFDVKVLVLDEADRMLDMGFAPQIDRIIKKIPRERQTMLFSATMAPEIVRLSASYLKTPIRVEIAPAGTTAEKISQELFIVYPEAKKDLLLKILEERPGKILVFVRTKHSAAIITRQLRTKNQQVAEIHSDRTMGQRREAIEGFKGGRYRVLVATDIAARGIDVKNIETVINFDLPDDTDSYVHRIGRTARAGKEGHAISLVTPDQERDVKSIERLIKRAIPISKHPDIPEAKFSRSSSGRSFQPRRGGGGFRKSGGGFPKRGFRKIRRGL